MELDKILKDLQEHMQKTLNHLDAELLKVRAGKASPAVLDGLLVDYYGAPTLLSQVANITTPDARTLLVQPWERKMLEPISKAIIKANLGFNPQNNGEVIMISIPALTEERRKDMVKKAKAETEDAKIGIRSVRKDAMEASKKLKAAGIAEDLIKDLETKIQKQTDDFIAKAEVKFVAKEKDIMTV
jgi:ribosome recycling factor